MTDTVDELGKNDVVADVLNAPADPWLEADPPYGWLLNKDGVAFKKAKPGDGGEDECVTIAGPVWIAGFTRNHARSGWGAIIKWIDRDGDLHERAIPAGRFHEQGPFLAQELAGEGLKIVPGQERKLLSYLGAFHTDRRVRSVDHLGWLDTTTGALAYVLPAEVITKGSTEVVVFQPEQHAPTTVTMKAEGDLADWQEHVAKPCRGNPLLVFGVCCGLAGPLAKPAGLDGGGFHLYGLTSRGKTLWEQLAASCFGCGADPSHAGDLSLIRRWNVTANGVEGLAAAHNDGPLLLDEIGTCTAKDFGALVYAVAGGQGKSAMDSNRKLKATRTWRCLVLSTGEVSTRQKIEEDGRVAKGGQLLRLIDIPIPEDGVIADAHGMARDKFVDALKRDCGLYYGTAGPAFVKALVAEAKDANDLRQTVQKLMTRFTDVLTPDKVAPEVKRAIKRFALVRVAGVMAARLGILPFTEIEIGEAVTAARNLWLDSTQGEATDSERGLKSVRAFILKHGSSRFEVIGVDAEGNKEHGKCSRCHGTGSVGFDFKNGKCFACGGSGILGGGANGRPVLNRAGFFDTGRDLWLFTAEGFKEACGGGDPKNVAREILRRGLLFVNETDRLVSKHSVPGLSNRLKLYAVKSQIVEATGDE